MLFSLFFMLLYTLLYDKYASEFQFKFFDVFPFFLETKNNICHIRFLEFLAGPTLGG